MIKKGFLKGQSDLLNIILRLSDVALVLVVGVVSYYFSNAYFSIYGLGK